MKKKKAEEKKMYPLCPRRFSQQKGGDTLLLGRTNEHHFQRHLTFDHDEEKKV